MENKIDAFVVFTKKILLVLVTLTLMILILPVYEEYDTYIMTAFIFFGVCFAIFDKGKTFKERNKINIFDKKKLEYLQTFDIINRKLIRLNRIEKILFGSMVIMCFIWILPILHNFTIFARIGIVIIMVLYLFIEYKKYSIDKKSCDSRDLFEFK